MQKGQILIWIIVGALIVIIAAGAYYLGRSSTPKPSTPPTVISQPTSTPDASREPNGSGASGAPNGDAETANWKTYTNIKYGYSLKYPSSFFIYEFSEPIYEPKGNIDTTEISNYETSDFSSGKINPDDPKVFVMLITYPLDKTTDLAIIREGYKDTQYIHYNVIDYSIGNQPALKIKMTWQVGRMTRGEVITVHKNKIFSFTLRSTNSKYASYLDQILSTFKFTQ